MRFLRGLRELVLGETWSLPAGVLVLLGSGAALRAAFPDLWRDVGAVHLALGAVAVLTVSLALTTRSRRARSSGDP